MNLHNNIPRKELMPNSRKIKPLLGMFSYAELALR